MDISNTTELLARHGDFVRGLARALLRDPGQADDVAQEAWTRWVTRPPRDTSQPRGWFAAVVRRQAANARRADERRARHEADAAQPEPAPSPLEQNEQAELVQRVIAEVMALEPEQRDTILSRYFRGLAVAELAAESGTSEDTVRTRERRALEKLRQRLDKHFGARATWALGLARLAERAPPPTAASAPSGAKWIGVAGALALASTAAVIWFALPRQESAAATSPVSSASAAAAFAEPGSPPNSPASPSGARVESPASSAPPPASVAASSSSSGGSTRALLAADQAEIRGTLLLEDGAPAAHVPWWIDAWESNEARVIEFGLPAEWTDPEGETEADGSFSLTFAPPPAFQFVFEAKAPGHAKASWRWGEIAPGSVVDLGTVTLARGATVAGRLVDAAGAPLLGRAWSVHVDSVGVARGDRDDITVFAELDPATGEFRAEDVMPGASRLSAYCPLARIVNGPRVVVATDQTVMADIVYDGPDNARRITVDTFCRPLYVFDNPALEDVQLLGPDGATHAARRIESSSQSLSFDDLAPGAYTLTIDDPRYRPWSRTGIVPGTDVHANLEPCSAVTLSATGPAGEPLALERLSVEFRGDGLPREIQVHDGSTPFGGSVRLVPGDYTLHARAGELEGEVDVSALGYDETRAVTLSLGDGAMLRGRVVDAGGAAVSGVQVFLLQPARQDDSRASPILPPNTSMADPLPFRTQLDAVASGADGSFAFRLGGGGAYLVYTERANGSCTDTPVLSLQDGEGRAGLELVLPPAASVSGTVRGLEGASSLGLRLWIGLSLGSRTGFGRLLTLDERAQTLPADGSFSFEGLPAGTMQALLLLPVSEENGTHSAAQLELGRFELAEGEALVRDFDGTPPGTVTIEVRVNGEPAPGTSLYVAQPYATPNRPQFNAVADGHGLYGPKLLFPGPWSVTAASGVQPTPLDVRAGEETRVVVDVEQHEGSLRFLDAGGAPLAKRGVSVFHQAAQGPPMMRQRRTTDGEGRASFTLAPGSYLLRLDADSARPFPFLGPTDVTVPLSWTGQGPLESEIHF